MMNDGAVRVISNIICHIMSSSSEAKVAALFINTKGCIILRNELKKLDRPQPATPLKTYNSTAKWILNGIMVQKFPKAMDIQFYWMQDREIQKQYKIYWATEFKNLGEYHTKHHPASHHHTVCNVYKGVLTQKILER